jgi:hypothetical protein
MLTAAFLQVMGFYLVLAFVVFPVAAYYFVGKSDQTLGNAWAAGSIVSVLLWFTVGKNRV